MYVIFAGFSLLIAQDVTLIFYVTTILFSFFAFSVAVLNLYFSTLKSPKITDVADPDFQIQRISKSATSIPNRIKINPDFVFVNTGSRTGALKLYPHFKAAVFERFFDFDSEVIKFKCNYEEASEMPYRFIKEREALTIGVELTIDFYDWKSYFVHDPVAESQICSVLLSADNENNKRFSEFCSLLADENPLARFSVDCEQIRRKLTARRPLAYGPVKDTIVKNEPIKLGKGSIEAFRYYLDKWDEIEPRYIFESLGRVERELDLVFEERVFRLIQARIEERGSFETYAERLTFRYYGHENAVHKGLDKPMIALLDFILESAGLKSLIDDFSRKKLQFARDLELLQRILPNGGKVDELQESTAEQAEELKSRNFEIWETANRIKQLLKNCINEGSISHAEQDDVSLHEVG
jgi:hypothetical protein